MGTKPDKNLFSFTGDEKGNIWLNGDILFWDKDYNGDTREYTLDFRDIDVADDIADTLKFSGARDLTVFVQGNVPGGYEDCIDINNHCKNLKEVVQISKLSAICCLMARLLMLLWENIVTKVCYLQSELLWELLLSMVVKLITGNSMQTILPFWMELDHIIKR
jgi:hypothetical protein